MTSCANAELSESVGGGGFPLPSLQHVCLFCSDATQHPFLTRNRDTSVTDKVCYKEWKPPERQPGQTKASFPYSYGVTPYENYESRSTVMRDKMSDTKVHVTDEQPWVAVRGGGAAQPRTHQNAHRSGRKCSRGPQHQCPYQAREQERWERIKGREREGEENKGRGGGNEGKQRGKIEKGGENRGRDKVKMCQVWKPKVKKKRKKKLISCIEGGKNTATHQSKSTAQRGKLHCVG